MSNAISPGLQMRECMKAKACPKWSMEDPACFDHFNCTTLFRQVDCVVVCSDRTIGEFICLNLIRVLVLEKLKILESQKLFGLARQ